MRIKVLAFAASILLVCSPLRRLVFVLIITAFASSILSAQSAPSWGRDYIFGPGGQLTVTAERDPYPPTAPAGLSGTWHPTSCSVTLSWAASTDAGTGINGYGVYQNDILEGGPLGNKTTYSDFNVSGGHMMLAERLYFEIVGQ
jgi:hypothetical protein